MTLENAKLAKSSVVLNDLNPQWNESFKVELPEILATPACDNSPKITNVALQALSVPNGFVYQDFVSFDLDDLSFEVH